MDTKTLFLQELDMEAAITREFIKRYDQKHADFKPHEKSMSLKQLINHVVEVNGWMKETIENTELIMSPETYKPLDNSTKEELLAEFDKRLAVAKEVLQNASEDDLDVMWSMKGPDGTVYFSMPRRIVIKTMITGQTVHHRAQLGVYYRLLNIPVPKTYGPSADEQ